MMVTVWNAASVTDWPKGTSACTYRLRHSSSVVHTTTPTYTRSSSLRRAVFSLPRTARNISEKFTPARKENTVMIHITTVLCPAMDISRVEKPPVAMVVSAWLTAKNQSSPARRRHTASAAVSAT